MSSTLIRKRKTDTDDILPALFQMTQTILNCVSTEAQQRLTNIDKMEIIVGIKPGRLLYKLKITYY